MKTRNILLALGLAVGLFLFLRSRVAYKVTGKLNAEQTKAKLLIANLAKVNGYTNFFFLQGLALEESSLDPSAKSNRTSYGLFQIFHASNFSWLRWAGFTSNDFNKLFDPTFNTNLAIKVVRYFESRGFVFPRDADVYNVGETEWQKGKRNVDYRNKVIEYTDQFKKGEY